MPQIHSTAQSLQAPSTSLVTELGLQAASLSTGLTPPDSIEEWRDAQDQRLRAFLERASTPRHQALVRAVVDAARTVFDPEIPVNIYELGLIYDVQIDESLSVTLKMTLTSPACPVAGTLPVEVQRKLVEISGVTAVHVELVWEPPWEPSMMSEAAQLELGFN